MKKFVLLLFSYLLLNASGQEIPQHLINKPWNAKWITGAGDLSAYQVLKFRKAFELAAKPNQFIIHISADNRYKLFINGQPIAMGPARGDLLYWNFETIDLAPYLLIGKNILSALVWNDGAQKPEAQISNMTALIVQGTSNIEEIVNTNSTWLYLEDKSHSPLPVKVTGYYVAGPGERVDMNKNISGWEAVDFNDTGWHQANQLWPGIPKGVFTFGPIGWMLVPSTLPQMESKEERFQALRNTVSINIPKGFPIEKQRVTIPANTKIDLLLDQGYLTNGYPKLIISHGKNAKLELAYAESLYNVTTENLNNSWLPRIPKGNRNEVLSKTFIGKKDSIISNGTAAQIFEPLWWRTYRYVKISIETKAEALHIDDVSGTFTGYPFQFNAKLEADNQSLKKNLEIGWRTARLCAFETYMDCPYYEQLQYIGDTRIQALVSLYNSGDNRLVKSAIDWMDRSRLAEGITLSRYPTANEQMIPTFSLWWIGMVHDYWRYQPDADFVKAKLPGMRQVLADFHRWQQPDGSLKNMPYWIFTDWVTFEGWRDGVAPMGTDGSSAVLDIQLLWTYQLAAELEETMGYPEVARDYHNRIDLLTNTIRKKYWNDEKRIFADTPEQNHFSQHTNSLAILAGIATDDEVKTIARVMLTDKRLAPASIYFKYYLHLALTKAGLGNDYLTWLDKWTENINLGLTTWAEMSDVTGSRSDCHAWGSSPNIEFFRIVLGIDSDGPGFQKIKIEPHLGNLKKISGSIPHPNGKVEVSYAVEKKENWLVEINLPIRTTGSLIWNQKTIELKEGKNSLRL
jgi:alpha-L-rhamnosidase